MKKNILDPGKSILALLLMIVSFSCQSLEEVPEGISTPQNFYKTVSQCEAAYAGSMNALFVTWGGYQNIPAFPDGQYEGTSLDFGSTSFNDLWTWHYKAISNINEVLKAVKGGSLTGNPQETIDNVV